MYFSCTLCGGKQFQGTLSHRIAWAVQVRRGYMTFSASPFKHLWEDLGPTAPFYDGHEVIFLNHQRRGIMLEKIAARMLQDKYPDSELKDAVPGTCIDGRRRSLFHAEYDCLLDNKKIEFKSSLLQRKGSKWCVSFGFFRGINFQLLHELYLIIVSPKSLHLLKHDTYTGVVQSPTGDQHISMFGRAGSGWEESFGEILHQLCGVGSCEDIGSADIWDPLFRQLCEESMGYCYQFYGGKPFAAMGSILRSFRIKSLIQEVDRLLHPKSKFSRLCSSSDWKRDQTRVAAKLSSLCHCPRKDRWYCYFTGIKLGYFNELLLAIYSPRGLDIFRHDGVYGFGNLETVLPGQSKSFSVESAPGENDVWRSLQLIEDQLQANNCPKIASIPWDD